MPVREADSRDRRELIRGTDCDDAPVRGRLKNLLSMKVVGPDPQLSRHSGRLRELRAAYVRCDRRVTRSGQWHSWTLTDAQLQRFRGDNAYVWQRDGEFAVSLRSAKAQDHLGLLDKLSEDGAFGAVTIGVGGRTMSRDLLDSALELSFLDRHVSLTGKQVTDIGAGYGRLAHRATAAFDLDWTCTDAVPESTFLCEYYLSCRRSHAKILPLNLVSEIGGDLVTNVHSFTECTAEAVDWWGLDHSS